MFRIRKFGTRLVMGLALSLGVGSTSNATPIDFEVYFTALHHSINTHSPAGIISGPGPFPDFDFTRTFQLDSSLLAIDGNHNVEATFSAPFSSDGIVTSSIVATVSSGVVVDLLIDYNQTITTETIADIGGIPTVVGRVIDSTAFDSSAGLWTRVLSGSVSSIGFSRTSATVTTGGTYAITQLASSVPEPSAILLLLLAMFALGASHRRQVSYLQ